VWNARSAVVWVRRVGRLDGRVARPATAALLTLALGAALGFGISHLLGGGTRHGSVFVYVSTADAGSVEALSRVHRSIAAIAPTFFTCTASGGVAGSDTATLSAEARKHGIRLLPRFSCTRSDVVAAVLGRPRLASRLAASLCRLARDREYDGISVDFEQGAPADRDRFTRFIQRVATCLHPQGRLLSVYVAAKTDDLHRFHHAYFYDYTALARAADSVFVGAWGVHWSASRPGPIDPLPWVARVARYVAGLPLSQRFILGLAAYALDWRLQSRSAARALGSSQALALAAAAGVRTGFDPDSFSPYFRYRDRFGHRHEVWYGDRRSIAGRLRVARAHGLGVGFWRLGQEPYDVWSLPELS
jgi:spore germination protein YaaH